MSDQVKHLTVAVATYNRYELLRNCLEALAKQDAPEEFYEVLVIDNTADASLRQQNAGWISTSPNTRLLHSSPPGLSRARNCALSACETPFIAYIDDDAIPNQGWVSALLRAFDTSQAAVLAGPIVPIWSKPRPEWLPEKYEGCITILDYGDDDRWLNPGEFAYGANVAFRTELLRKAGGFFEAIGRTGSNLLSDEELEIQTKLQKQGHRIYYAADAGISHRVHENRLSRNWFRSRMAWQAVSEQMRQVPMQSREWAFQEIGTAASRLGMTGFVQNLLGNSDAQRFSYQLDLIRHLFSLFLQIQDEGEASIEERFTDVPIRFDSRKVGPAPEKILRPIAPVGLATRHLFFEGKNGHNFLYDYYGEHPHAQLLTVDIDLWSGDDLPLQRLEASINSRLATIVLLTVDPFISAHRVGRYLEFIGKAGAGVYGLLHRLPGDGGAALRQAAAAMRGILVLSEEMAAILRDEFRIPNVHYLPLQPSFYRYLNRRDAQPLRNALGVGSHQKVFSVLGEARSGKGLENLLGAIDHLTEAERARIFFLFGGQATHYDAEKIGAELRQKGCSVHMDLRKPSGGYDKALTDKEFSDYVTLSDVGVLVYQGAQKRAMSGVLPNYVWAGKPVVSQAGSIAGNLVERHHLGLSCDAGNPKVLARCLAEAAQACDTWRPDAFYEKFRLELAPDAVLARLYAILDGNVSN